MHIPEQIWTIERRGYARKDIQHLPDELKQLRKRSKLQTLTQSNPSVEQWIIQPYTANEITSVVKI